MPGEGVGAYPVFVGRHFCGVGAWGFSAGCCAYVGFSAHGLWSLPEGERLQKKPKRLSSKCVVTF